MGGIYIALTSQVLYGVKHSYNAFDLVRQHLFGNEDVDIKPNTRIDNYPSHKRMEELANADPEVSKAFRRNLYGTPKENFSTPIESDEDWVDLLETTTTGNLCKNANNIMLILENDPGLKDKLIFDRFTNRFLIKGFLPWDFTRLQEDRTWTDEDEDCLVNYIERNYRGIRVPTIVKSTLSELKLKKSTNVVTDYFNSLKWDGVPRIDTLLIDYFGTEDTIYSREIIRKELVAAVRRVVTEKAIKFDEMIILVGTQGQGKSTFLNKLGKPWYTDIKLKPDDKDTLVSLQKYMIVEVGELEGFNKLEVSALKSFLSKETDTYRAPYAQNAVEHPRHYVLFGTTNDNEFLRDPTGERRFWPIECFEEKVTKSVFTDLSKNEVDQIWAEAVYLNNKGESLLLSKEADKLAKVHQGLHKVHNPKEGEIKEFITKKVTKNWLKETDFSNYDANISSSSDLVDKDRICAAIVWCECFGNRNTGNMKIFDSKEINSILSTLKFEDRELVPYSGRFGKYGKQRGFMIIKKSTKSTAENKNVD